MSRLRSNANPIRDIPRYLGVFRIYIGARMYLLFVLSILGALAEGLGIVMVLPLLQVIDGFQSEQVTPVGSAMEDVLRMFGLADSVLAILLVIAALFLSKAAFMFSAGCYKAYLNGHLMKEMKTRMYDDYSHMRYQYYVQRDTGYFFNLINKQINGFLGAFTQTIRFCTSSLVAMIYLALAMAVAWRFGLMAIMLGGAVLLVFKVLNVYVRDLSRQAAHEDGILSKLIIQSLQSFKYLVATGQGGKPREQTLKSIRKVVDLGIRSDIAGAFTRSIREPLVVISILGIIAVQLLWLQQPLAAILVSIVLFKRGLDSILNTQIALQQAMSKMGSVEKVELEFKRLQQEREVQGKIKIGPLAQGVRFEKVCFRYSEKQPNVIDHIDLEIRKLQSIALVGESGAGKSTLVDMLTLMLRPNSGRILIDGVPTDDIVLSTWRKQIGYVSQDTVIFDDTLANNICMWTGDPPTDEILMERVREAARQAHIAHFIETLPEGFHTRVGDRGVRLSGGQRQRLFIARELFRKPNLLILDEATSALDTESEKEIQKSIDGLRGKMTVVIIAHRLSTVRNVDRVYVLDSGRIIEQGSFAELRGDDSTRFASLVEMQEL